MIRSWTFLHAGLSEIVSVEALRTQLNAQPSCVAHVSKVIVRTYKHANSEHRISEGAISAVLGSYAESSGVIGIETQRTALKASS